MAKAVKDLTPGDMRRMLEALSKKHSKINQRLIDAGRGYETFNETLKKDDPLALAFRANYEAASEIEREAYRRWGSEWRAALIDSARRRTISRRR